MKVVINSSYGDFELSEEAHILYAKLKGYKIIKEEFFGEEFFGCPTLLFKNEVTDENLIDDWTFDRSDPDLVKVVTTLGEKSGDGKYCILKVVEIPDDVKWYIANHHQGDGEFIEEEHRTWK
jgi:hypothetical protein